MGVTKDLALRHYLCGLQSFWTLLDLELDRLTFGECLETVPLDGGEVYKHIIAAVRGSNKAKAFGFVKPFNGTCCHEDYLNQVLKSACSIADR
jgi:hypothetical protein